MKEGRTGRMGHRIEEIGWVPLTLLNEWTSWTNEVQSGSQSQRVNFRGTRDFGELLLLSLSLRNESMICLNCRAGPGGRWWAVPQTFTWMWPRDASGKSCASGGDLPRRAEAMACTTGGYHSRSAERTLWLEVCGTFQTVESPLSYWLVLTLCPQTVPRL